LYEQLHNKTTTRKLEQIIYKRIPKKEVFSWFCMKHILCRCIGNKKWSRITIVY
jgi:hypothetical protein